MAFNLMALLQGAGIVPPSPGGDRDILVNGTKQGGASPLMGLGNKDQLAEAADAAKNAPAREGMFHTKGTLRDVLGTLGDAFLIQSGNNPIYTPRRQQEKISDAYSGFTGASGADPAEVQRNQQAALERLAATPGGAELAQKAYAQMQDNQTRQTVAQGVAAQKGDALYLNKINKLSTLASNTLAGTKTPEETAAAVKRLRGLAGALGVKPEDLGITEDMTPEDIRAIALGNQTPYQQQSIPINQQNADSRSAMVGVSRQNAGTNAARAAETGRHNRTVEPIMKQNADANTTRAAKAGKGGGLVGNVPPPPGGGGAKKFVYRNGKLVAQ
jgi:hypothetical protein